MKIACIKNNIVTSVVEVDESEVPALAASHDSVVECSSAIPAPQVGWLLSGNILVPNVPVDVSVMLEQRVASAIASGRKIKDEVTAKIGARNLLLGKTEAQISALVSNLISIGFLLEGGALVTARAALQGIAPSYPEYADEFDFAVLRINQVLG